MNPNTDETLLARWLDGEMPADEHAAFEARLATDATLREEADMLKSLRSALQAAIPRQVEIPHADFFNSQIQRRIEEMRTEGTRQSEAKGGLFGWLRMPWLAIAATCITAYIGYSMWDANRPKTVVLNMYAPNGEIKAKTFHSTDANATVLELDGLAAVPADRPVVGYRVGHSETNQEVAMTTLFGEDGHVLLVLAEDNRNQPRFIAH